MARCRVAGPRCRDPAPSEPDVTIARHPAQASAAFILAARKIRSWIRPTTASVAVQSTLDHVIGCRPSVCSALTV
jgi:hypothetical protein